MAHGRCATPDSRSDSVSIWASDFQWRGPVIVLQASAESLVCRTKNQLVNILEHVARCRNKIFMELMRADDWTVRVWFLLVSVSIECPRQVALHRPKGRRDGARIGRFVGSPIVATPSALGCVNKLWTLECFQRVVAQLNIFP